MLHLCLTVVRFSTTAIRAGTNHAVSERPAERCSLWDEQRKTKYGDFGEGRQIGVECSRRTLRSRSMHRQAERIHSRRLPTCWSESVCPVIQLCPGEWKVQVVRTFICCEVSCETSDVTRSSTDAHCPNIKNPRNRFNAMHA